MKWFNKWFRKIHRWIAIPTAILIPLAVIIKFSGNPNWQVVFQQFEKLQSILMLLLAITGAYLLLLPYLSKWQRQQRRQRAQRSTHQAAAK